MNRKKAVLLITIVLVMLLMVGAAYAARSREAPKSEKKGIGGQFFQGIGCLFKCGWPAWIVILLPPIAVWFYTRFIHVF